MKKFNPSKMLLFIAVAAISFTSCDDDDNDNIIPSTNTAYDLVSTNPNFSVLKEALDLTGLDQTLQSAGTFTVFAPDNEAFANFLMDNNISGLDDIPVADLRATLLYHVLPVEVMSGNLSDGYVKTSANNSIGESLDLYVQTGAQATLNGNNLDMDSLDIDVDNGVVHVLDDVLTLPTIVDLAGSNPTFSSLVAALDQENLVDVLDANVGETGSLAPFTVFAPTNQAFVDLIDADPNDGLNNIGDILALATLSDILQFHVVAGTAVRAGGITDDAPVDPITAGTFSIDLDTTPPEITVNGSVVARIIATDVTATNGVIHAIDFILLP
jgi:uncharacterized surface protein with fasciclin (FAS1) repeats